jgi:hypothetical protein
MVAVERGEFSSFPQPLPDIMPSRTKRALFRRDSVKKLR